MRDLLKAFASLAAAVVTTGAMHTQSDTAQVILGRGADYIAAANRHHARDPQRTLQLLQAA